jgi:hypothetical protein
MYDRGIAAPIARAVKEVEHPVDRADRLRQDALPELLELVRRLLACLLREPGLLDLGLDLGELKPVMSVRTSRTSFSSCCTNLFVINYQREQTGVQ